MSQSLLIGSNLLKFLREGFCAVSLPSSIKEIIIHSKAVATLTYLPVQSFTTDTAHFSECDKTL